MKKVLLPRALVLRHITIAQKYSPDVDLEQFMHE